MRKTLITTSIIAAVFAMPAFADPTAQELLDQKTVTSKYYVDTTKQDKITTDKVLFIEGDGKAILEDIYVPALVLTNSAGTTLNANTVGMLDQGTLSDVTGLVGSSMHELRNLTAATYDSFVPTVRAVANELSSIWTRLGDTLSWTSTETSAVNAYDTDFSNKGMWPSGDYDKYITGSSLAQGLALKQNIIAAGTSGNVVTYTGTAGQVGSVGVYNGSTTYNASTDASKLATAGFVETKQEKLTCAGYLAGHENDDDYCWLYSLESQASAPSCLAYGEGLPRGADASVCCSGVGQNGGLTLCGCAQNSDCPSSARTCNTANNVCS
ncbi:MAG: hypothetical protein J6T27_03105 [Alphaproteobacteria bacterium]|nr:hypothetical protein [Alphaproteobacteria bacterium]